MSRSLKVHKGCIFKVKESLKRNGYPRQKDLAEELVMSLSTVSSFLNGKPVDVLNFQEICNKLGFNWRDLACPDEEQLMSDSVLSPESPMFSFWQEEQDDIYVERPPIESHCYEELLKPGALVRIKAPGLTGKTSLIARILRQLDTQGYQTVYLNLHLAETKDFTTIDTFLRWLCMSVGQRLKLQNRLDEHWDEKFDSSKNNCTVYFEHYLLHEVNRPLILCLDEVDRVFPHPEVASEFLGLLRAWHEQAKTLDVWKRLRLMIAHSTAVYIPLNIDESPFNVGVPIQLPEFTPAQINRLAQLHELNWTEAQTKQLMDIIGGHPYLVKESFSYLRSNRNLSLDQFLQTSVTESGIYQNHLRHLWRMIEKSSALVEALRKVIASNASVRLEERQTYQLHSMGIVCLQGNNVAPRCELYRSYFRDRIGSLQKN